MKKREIYLRAAEIIARGDEDFSCWAIDEAANGVGVKLVLDYHRHFAPDESVSPSEAWGWQWGRDDNYYSLLVAQQCRVLALCFMAAIVGDEEVK